MSIRQGEQNPNNIYPYIERKKTEDELPPDYFSILSLVFGLVGLMLKKKWGSWVSLVFVMASVVNAKKGSSDLKQFLASFSFAFVGLISNYFAAVNKQEEA
jgi:hypothetical protein